VSQGQDEPILRAIGRLAPWAALSFILPNSYNQLDAYFLGKVSPTASNALGLFMMVQIATFGVVLVHARGTQSLVGRRVGAGQHAGAGLAIGQGLGLAMRVVVPFTLLLWAFAPQILAFMGGAPDVVAEATSFLRTLFLFMPFLFAQPILDFSFQALGDTATPFKLQCLAVLVNAGLNWVLVLPHVVHLGSHVVSLPGHGVVGSAVATGVSRLLVCVLGFRIMVRRYGFPALLQRSGYRWDGRVVREILRVGLPAGASTLLYALVGVFILQVVGHFNQDAFGAYGIGFRGVESLSFMVLLGIGAATGIVTAHAVGRADFERARRAGHVGTAVACALMLLTGGCMALFPRQLAGIYSSDPEIIAIAAGYIRLMALCQIPQALETVYGDAMAGAGSTARTVAISIPGNALRVPLAWLFAVTFEQGLQGVWLAILASAVLKGAGVSALYASGRWEKAMHRGRELLHAA